jgi:hypothetical protein
MNVSRRRHPHATVVWFDQRLLGDDYEEMFGKFIPDRAFARWENTEQEMRGNLEELFGEASESLFAHVFLSFWSDLGS